MHPPIWRMHEVGVTRKAETAETMKKAEKIVGEEQDSAMVKSGKKDR